MTEKCGNCNEAVTGDFCNSCGQARELKKIDRNYVIQELLSLVGYENGFIFTFRELLVNPGEVIREYITRNRQKITKPITFLILTSVIYTLISHYFKTDIPYNDQLKKDYGNSSVFEIMNWVQNNYGYSNLLLILPITCWTRLLFRKSNYNFYETCVVICFVMAEGMLLFSLESILNGLFPGMIVIYETVTFILAFFYIGWGIGQFYGKKIKNYFKAFFAYSLGMITFQIIVIVVGITYDMIMKG